MNRDELKAKFPSYFPIDELPEGAKEQELKVYRVCKWGKIEHRAFLTTYEEKLYLNCDLKGMELEPDLDDCSMSCYEALKDAQRRLDYFTEKEPASILSQGVTEGAYGLSQQTRQRKKVRLKSHVDWWLYKDVDVHYDFSEVINHENT